MSEYQLRNPATGQTEATYDAFTDEQIIDAIGRADSAYRSWRTTPLDERVAALARVGELYRDRADRLAEIIAREMGKPVRQGLGEIALSADIYTYYADNAAEFLKDEELSVASGGSAVVRTAPLGALLGIMPWNYPYYQVARFAAPNLALGNTILLKHAPNCPESALAIEGIFRDAGLPADAYINIFASVPQVADIIADPRVQGVSLTGSERAGRSVGEIAGRHLKKAVLELGGSDPLLVLDTDNLDGVVSQSVAGRLSNAGQACNSPKRFIVVDELYDEFVEKVTAKFQRVEPGDPIDANTRFGPLSSERAVSDLLELIDDAREKGATIRAGGERYDREGSWMQPTVVTDITPDMRLYREEAFGPVATVYRVPDVDAAVELANDSPFGLGAAVFTGDEQLADDVADRLDAGMIAINGTGGTAPDLPFGGVKMSGIGRELGRFGIDEFANKKLVRRTRG
ncbi:succinate-semialdehyde dehydrogenase [NADP(+)] [Pseudoclavibacter endophyticus]|uniref:NAD-dependent succinate-semialdehyde dehydrogenase n=1 Tax=Pseudoclavibacter endophyticus TaxID=1778590 RepID=A0A6H9WJD3_9MICO|nr:NAD-dependent succinate-semialdehyde dehydrogenase [Pseudoclavibacter endophyticus]KAB1649303.1 NAD-dependent succinate-semialdehyde dehydrogenase [Pseudoclavibacter endophyticus]GGA63648.1 succinate-semialdehyde dehydrogenase [NADP(+)] [Pseudoclavibacter endophyticus]